MSATGLIDHVVRPHVAQTEQKYLDADNVAATGAQTYIPGQWPAGVNRVVSNVLALFEASTMSEHCAPMPILAKNVVWDAPPFLLSRKGSVRVSAYLFKFIAKQRFVPSLVQVRRVGMNSHLVEVSGTLLVYPRRTILLPATLLLPEAIPVRSTISIGVNGSLDTGMVELVAVKWHNLPSLPNFMRAGNGLAFGTVPHLLEPLWSYLPEFIGDDFYRRKREATFQVRHPNSTVPAFDAAKDVVKDTTSGVMDYGVDTVHNLWDGTTYLYNNVLEALGFSLGRARAYTATAANLAAEVAGTAYNTAANVAGTAVNVAGQAAGTAYSVANQAAGTAYNVAGQAAGTAYNVAGNVAGTAYNTAANVAGTAAEAAGTAANVAAGTASMAYDTAANAAATAGDAAYRTGAVAADTARSAYDSAAETGRVAYQAGKETGARAYETGKETVDVAAQKGKQTVDEAAYRVEKGTEDFQRGYEKGKNKPVDVPVPGTNTKVTSRSPAGVASY
eukprot:GHRQ01000029.1.p1 GENE.GHRQ01000029.1~~GHRQ01000029.1.p1  ORF type:complete len:558 (+),score=216.73 GHRQ01000029.1:166-1674(+)